MQYYYNNTYKDYDKKHLQEQDKLDRELLMQYYLLISSIVTKVAISDLKGYQRQFRFVRYPRINDNVNELLHKFSDNVENIIQTSVENKIELSLKKNNLLNTQLSVADIYKKVNKKIGGVKVSNKIWKYTKQYKGEIENVITYGLIKNKPKQQIIKDLKYYLKQPEVLFNRTKNDKGELVLEKNTKNYYTGTGVYRSSYKNILRFVNSEIDGAYKLADNYIWQKTSGIKYQSIELSSNHTCNGVPFYDMCDELVGVYPIEWIFRGWHPLCRCIARPVMHDTNIEGVLPDTFINWYLGNFHRFKSNNMPYFMSDNAELIKKAGLPFF